MWLLFYKDSRLIEKHDFHILHHRALVSAAATCRDAVMEMFR